MNNGAFDRPTRLIEHRPESHSTKFRDLAAEEIQSRESKVGANPYQSSQQARQSLDALGYAHLGNTSILKENKSIDMDISREEDSRIEHRIERL
jgi:hypothetical protein